MSGSRVIRFLEPEGSLEAESLGSQSEGTGARHHGLPGESSPTPSTQYLLPFDGGRLQAMRALTLLPPGRCSTRTRVPVFRGRLTRTPQPFGLTINV